MNIELSGPAETDIAQAAAHYQAEAGLGNAFFDEVDRAFDRILQYPHAWTMLSRRARRCPLGRFPYGVIYQIRGDLIRVVAVFHLHRKPGSWRSRLEEGSDRV